MTRAALWAVPTVQALLLGALAAQNITVFPSDHAGTGGNLTDPGASYTTYFPFANGKARQMAIYDAWDVHIQNGRSISRIGFVANENATSNGYAILLKVDMGKCRLSLDNTSTTFAANYDGAPTTVFADPSGNPKIFNVPNLTGTGFAVWLPLDRPFVFDNTRNLVVDFMVHANQNSDAPFPYYLDAASHRTLQRNYGAACTSSGGRLPDIDSGPSSTWIGGNWSLVLQNGPSSANSVLLIGVVPFDPGISLDPIGMNGCLLSVDALWAGPFTTGGSGYASWSFPIPFIRSLFGGKLYSQAVMYDFFANNFHHISSNADEVTVGIKPQAVLISSARGNPPWTTGAISRNFGAITLFDHN